MSVWVEPPLPNFLAHQECAAAVLPRCRLAKHTLSRCPDELLLETPADRFTKVERRHAAQHLKEQARTQTVHEREKRRDQKLDAWRAKIERASRQLEARREAAIPF